jgi:cyclophilin family peptidyl-prolyl cis-trans isomerase
MSASSSSSASSGQAQQTLLIAGRVHDAAYHAALALGAHIAAGSSIVVRAMPFGADSEWEAFTVRPPVPVPPSSRSPWCFLASTTGATKFVGHEKELEAFARASRIAIPEEGAPAAASAAAAREAFASYLRSLPGTLQFLRIAQGATARLVLLHLLDDRLPRASANFAALCAGTAAGPSGAPLSYKGSPIHRVVPGGFVQGGDVVSGSGADSRAALPSPFGDGRYLEDESFDVRHDVAGVLGYANHDGLPHTNGSQFYITLVPSPWLDGKSVAFGRVILGLDWLRAISHAPHTNQRPHDVRIADAGPFDVASGAWEDDKRE